MKLNIYFFAWDNYFAKAIRVVTGDEWSHVGIGYFDGTHHHIWEAISQGVVSTLYGRDIESIPECKIIGIQCPDVEKDEFIEIADLFEGRGYGWLDIACILLMLGTGLRLEFLTNSRTVICSETVVLILTYLEIVDLEEVLDKEASFITPQDIYDFFTD